MSATITTPGDLSADELQALRVAAERRKADGYVKYLVTPATMLRLIAMAKRATTSVPGAAGAARSKLSPTGDGCNEWYFDCEGHYIDVRREDGGKYSVYFRNRSDQSEAWMDQSEAVAEPAQVGREVFEAWAKTGPHARSGDSYHDLHTAIAWEAFKAGSTILAANKEK